MTLHLKPEVVQTSSEDSRLQMNISIRPEFYRIITQCTASLASQDTILLPKEFRVHWANDIPPVWTGQAGMLEILPERIRQKEVILTAIHTKSHFPPANVLPYFIISSLMQKKTPTTTPFDLLGLLDPTRKDKTLEYCFCCHFRYIL